MSNKQEHSDQIGRLAKALEKRRQGKTPPGNPNGPPAAYRFKSGPEWQGNAAGRPPRAIYVQALTDRLMRSTPPKELCAELGIDPRVTWGEAILISLSKAAMSGDVSAAREVMAALGFSGTAARSLVAVNVESPEQRSVTFEFLRHSHGLSEDQLSALWVHMDSLERQKPVVDDSYFPDATYSENDPVQQLTDGATPKEDEQ